MKKKVRMNKMAYGVYSEVYLAFSVDNPTAIKIGETTNARRRERQLIRQDPSFYIGYSTEITKFDKGSRLYVENYLRGQIFKYLNNKSIDYRWVGLDYFYSLPQEAIDYIEKHFIQWVYEACQEL
jgi:hypothetical protein